MLQRLCGPNGLTRHCEPPLPYCDCIAPFTKVSHNHRLRRSNMARFARGRGSVRPVVRGWYSLCHGTFYLGGSVSFDSPSHVTPQFPQTPPRFKRWLCSPHFLLPFHIDRTSQIQNTLQSEFCAQNSNQHTILIKSISQYA
jgi:hypothetical protein